ncbi:hypothetical protein [Fimbriiglobus ruber]|nr:hypothetical protein [Fimbriiglobus ruber]
MGEERQGVGEEGGGEEPGKGKRMKLDFCPFCKRDIDLNREPAFDTREDNHIERCVIRTKRYSRKKTSEIKAQTKEDR